MKNKKNFTKLLRRAAALATIVCVLVCAMLPLNVFATNEKVTDCASGVLQVNLAYRDDNNTNLIFKAGSGFLINSDTLVTCAHCVNMTDAECAIFAEYFGKSVSEFKDRLSYSVTVTRDVTVSASILKMSVEMDFAILQLSQSLQNSTPLTIRSSSDVERTEVVYAIGFPDESSQIQAVSTYTSDDATITQGVVNKIDRGTNLYSGADTDYLQTSCKLTSGNSGGPMVDENGYVIGVCEGATGTVDGGDDYFYAIAIDQVTQICDALGISYTSSEAPIPVESAAPVETTEPAVEAVDVSALQAAIAEAESVDSSKYTAESYDSMKSALNSAKDVLTSDSQIAIDSAVDALRRSIDELEIAEESNSNLMIILIIAAAVVVAIVVIIIVVVASGSKKKKTTSSRPAPAKAANHANPAQVPAGSGAFASYQMQTPMTGRPNGTVSLAPESGETTVLNQGAGETTVLSNQVNGGSLIRLSTKERVAINKSELTIGRERKRVDFCISDNTSISRVHAKVVIREGKAYLVDLNAANGTFVNGVKASPNQEVALKDGDKITLAAEDFEYHA